MRLSLLVLFVGLVVCSRGTLSAQVNVADDDLARTAIREAFEALKKDDPDAALANWGRAFDGVTGRSLAEVSELSSLSGAMARLLNSMDAEERYDALLKWSFPEKSRENLRLLSLPVPRHQPPKVFAREIGERPRDETFAVAAVGPMRGFYSSGWMLVRSAREIGRLSRLQADLETLAAQQVSGADDLLLLALIANPRPEIEAIRTRLELIASLAFGEGTNSEAGLVASGSVNLSALTVALAALSHEELHPAAEKLVTAIERSLSRLGSESLKKSIVREALALTVQTVRGTSDPQTLRTVPLRHWTSITGMNASRSATGHPYAMWLVHRDHLLHMTGSGSDVLFFRYPLAGEFTFRCESQEGGAIGTDGGLVYGGLEFEALGRGDTLNVRDVDHQHSQRRTNRFTRNAETPTFNGISIRSTADGFEFLANQHPVWMEKRAANNSPWLGLRSFGQRRPLFRNITFSGSPEIPREVSLISGSSLHGWQTGFYVETRPPFVTGGDAINDEPADWSVSAGVIEASTTPADPEFGTQSLLRYHRPLLDGETIEYEFLYEPDAKVVHPAFGRLAFLIEPRGVRVHWLTDGPTDWTGLPEDNATLEPFNRRGPRPLPLKANDWNAVRLERTGSKLTLSLNDEVIYLRTIDFEGDQQFGLYRDRTKSAVRVRNVTLRGDWPTEVPKNLLEKRED